MVDVGTPGNRAGTSGNDDLRRGDRVVGLLEGERHVRRDRSGDQQTVGVPWRCDELDAEAAEVEDNRSEDTHVRLAGVAAACAHDPQLQRASEQPSQSLVECMRSSHERAPREQLYPWAHRQPVLLRMDDGAFRTRLYALGAEETAP